MLSAFRLSDLSERLNEIHFATTLYIPPTRPAELDHSFLELLR